MDIRRRTLSKWLNFTPTPLTAPVIGLIIALVFGLSTDYEVFLVSRMVEARERGMSTQEAIRIGTAATGRIITAAALIVAVVAGAFVFSDLVMMKYLAFGLMAALLLDATVVRMFLVPSVMKLLGDDCWWAPRWARRLQTRIGLGEIHLPDERKRPVSNGRPARPPVTAGLVAARAAGDPRPPHDPTHPLAESPRPARSSPASSPELTPALKQLPRRRRRLGRAPHGCRSGRRRSRRQPASRLPVGPCSRQHPRRHQPRPRHRPRLPVRPGLCRLRRTAPQTQPVTRPNPPRPCQSYGRTATTQRQPLSS